MQVGYADCVYPYNSTFTTRKTTVSSNTIIPVGTNPFTKQEAGTHYVNMAIQPMLFATVNCYDPCAFSILKYVSRHRSKNGIQDLKKARHCVELRQAMLSQIQQPVGNAAGMTIEHYVTANKTETRDADVLITLHNWVMAEDDGVEFNHSPILIELIDDLIRFA